MATTIIRNHRGLLRRVSALRVVAVGRSLMNKGATQEAAGSYRLPGFTSTNNSTILLIYP